MPLPEITHLQYLVLEILLPGDLAGKEIRDRLAEAGGRKSGPAFYQFMSRLEEGKFVEGWYDQRIEDGQMIRERKYRITGEGMSAYNTTLAFYLQRKSSGVTNLGTI